MPHRTTVLLRSFSGSQLEQATALIVLTSISVIPWKSMHEARELLGLSMAIASLFMLHCAEPAALGTDTVAQVLRRLLRA